MKQYVRTKYEPFTNSLIKNASVTEKSLNALPQDIDTNKMVSVILSLQPFASLFVDVNLAQCSKLNYSTILQPCSRPLSALVKAILSDKKPEEVPQVSFLPKSWITYWDLSVIFTSSRYKTKTEVYSIQSVSRVFGLMEYIFYENSFSRKQFFNVKYKW